MPDGASSFVSWCSSTISAVRHVPRGLLGEAHHQHGADGEVRRDEARDSPRPRERVELRQAVLRQTGRSDDAGDARAESARHVPEHGRGSREVDRRVVAGERGLLPHLDAGHLVSGLLERARHHRADLAVTAEEDDLHRRRPEQDGPDQIRPLRLGT